jgi:hypothetical protein
MSTDLEKAIRELAQAANYQAAATLAAGMIAASGRPHSIEEAMALAHEIHFTIQPAPGFKPYDDWAKTKDVRLKKTHK